MPNKHFLGGQLPIFFIMLEFFVVLGVKISFASSKKRWLFSLRRRNNNRSTAENYAFGFCLSKNGSFACFEKGKILKCLDFKIAQPGTFINMEVDLC